MTPEELEALLRDPSVPFEERRDRVRTLQDVETVTAAGLQSSAEAQEWGTFELFLLAAAAHPDPRYTRPITTALSLRSRAVPNEDALEVLADIGDPSTLDLLKEIAMTEYEWDSQIGVKAVWAIKAIDTPEATAALQHIAEHGDEYVRPWAERALARR